MLLSFWKWVLIFGLLIQHSGFKRHGDNLYISLRWNWYTQSYVSRAVIAHKVERYFREFELDKVEKD